MPELIVTARELRYARKSHLKGARFHASDKDAKVLKALGKADDAPDEVKPVRKVAETVAPAPTPVVAEPMAEPLAEPTDAELALPRRFYGTRRMKAED